MVEVDVTDRYIEIYKKVDKELRLDSASIAKVAIELLKFEQEIQGIMNQSIKESIV